MILRFVGAFTVIILICKPVMGKNSNNDLSNSVISNSKVHVKKIMPPSIPISQCESLITFSNGPKLLDADAFIKDIDAYSKSMKDYKIIFPSRDKAYNSSQSDIKQSNNIIDQTLKFQTSYFEYPTFERGEKLKKILVKLFSTGFLSKIDRQNSDTRYNFGHFLAIALHSYDVLKSKGVLSQKEDKEISTEIRSRFNLLAKAWKPTWFKMKHCKPGIWLKGKNCANHTYYEHYLRTLYGFVFDEKQHFMAGEKMFKFALDDSKPDIGLWREASRGYWSWHYVQLGLTDLAGIAEIYRRKGIDLYKNKSDISGLNYEDLIRLFVSAIKDKELMYAYAKKNSGLKGREGDLRNPTYFNKVFGGEFPERSNWYYLYKGRFPNSPAIQEYEGLVKGLDELSEYHSNVGFNPQCKHAESTINDVSAEQRILKFKKKEAERAEIVSNYINERKSKILKELEEIAAKNERKARIIMNKKAYISVKNENRNPKKSYSIKPYEFQSVSSKVLDDKNNFLSFKIKLEVLDQNNDETVVNNFKVMIDFDNQSKKVSGEARSLRVEIVASEYLNPLKVEVALNCEKSTIKKKHNNLFAYRLYSGRNEYSNKCALSTMTKQGRKGVERLLATLSQVFINNNTKMSDPYGILEKHSQFLFKNKGQ
tara:strand:+ start:219 stop:2171 length:1953 start_codon:yes stop_codon:yes gene_type:complete